MRLHTFLLYSLLIMIRLFPRVCFRVSNRKTLISDLRCVYESDKADKADNVVYRLNNELEKRAYNYLISDVNIIPGTKILLCVSGGVDSMAMLHLLQKVRTRFEPPLDLEVITFNHKMRTESDEEANFVSGITKAYGIPFNLRILDEKMRVTKGLQSVAREWRRKECLKLLSAYNTYNETSGSNVDSVNKSIGIRTDQHNAEASVMQHSLPIACIATAHHEDDVLETFLLKLIRGVHLSHLTGMTSRSECGRFIKPLLFMNKNEIVKYMKLNNFEWREDSSNLSRKYKRNEIRLDVIPLLQKLAGGDAAFKKRIFQLSSQSIDLKKWILQESRHFMINNVKYKRVETKNGITHVAVIREITPEGKYFHLSNLVKMSIFDEICQNLTLRQNVDMPLTLAQSSEIGIDVDTLTVASDEEEYLPRNNGTGCFLSHDLLVKLANISSQNLSPDDLTKSVHISDNTVFTRTGSVIRIERQPFSRKHTLANKKLNNHNTADGLNSHINNEPVYYNLTVDDVHFSYSSIFNVSITTLVKAPKVYKRYSNTDDANESKKSADELINILSEEKPIVFDVFNIPTGSHLKIRLLQNGDMFRPHWKRALLKAHSFLRELQVPSELRPTAIAVELTNRDISNVIISIPPFMSLGYEARRPNNTTLTRSAQKRNKHFTMTISKII